MTGVSLCRNHWERNIITWIIFFCNPFGLFELAPVRNPYACCWPVLDPGLELLSLLLRNGLPFRNTFARPSETTMDHNLSVSDVLELMSSQCKLRFLKKKIKILMPELMLTNTDLILGMCLLNAFHCQFIVVNLNAFHCLFIVVNPRRASGRRFKTDKGLTYTAVRENEPTLLSREK